MTQEAGNQPEIKLLPISEMETMSHEQLYRARINAKTPEEQKHIAPYEHRAFAREFVEQNPVTGAVGLAVAIPGYQAAKATGATGSRTGVDTKQMVEGYKGVAEGLSKAVVEPWKRVWNRLEESILQPIPKDVPIKPWEKNWEGRPEGRKAIPSTVKRSVAEDKMAAEVILTPKEQSRGDIYDLTDANIRELKQEIDKAKDNNIRSILQIELKKLLEKKIPGLIEEGNIDLNSRPKVKNPDGSISTVRSLGVNINGIEVLIPTVIDGRVVSDDEAVNEYERTGKHLGKFKTTKDSENYAKKLSARQGKQYLGER